ncbi:hypothetical protein Pcinc_013755 [Petrolisthes cinctipes]|uniref:Platelet-derived growth factor (PDGF) family profile domain-containing protein n=1 Tax=Petrolisthes cinctipes TaxID=88211 RepID=A0AAE1G1W6_PETCI|nr:hypothetical protein Pcinc_013755 [Petrolisthes cinctipes]
MDISDLLRLNSLTNISDFASFLSIDLPPEEKEKDRPSDDVRIHTRFGTPSETVEEVKMAEMANCKPELTTVSLDLPKKPTPIFFPTCVRIEQCGGCCYGPLLTCRPTVTEVVRLKVLKTTSSAASSRNSNTNNRPGSGSERSRGTTTRRRRRRRQSVPSFHEVQVERHTACGCGCRVQASDCNLQVQDYREGECACVCKNRDEKTKCEEQNSTKYWDNASCNCYCRRPLDCSTGQFFSHESCKCEEVVGRSGLRGPTVEDTFLTLQPVPIVPFRRGGGGGVIPFTPRRRKPVRVPLF